MIPPKISFNVEKLVFSALLFTIVATFGDGPLIVVAQSSNNNSAQTVLVNVVVVLDLETWVGQMGLSCISMSLYDFYSSNPSYKTWLVLDVRDSKQDKVIDAAAGSLSLSLSLSNILTGHRGENTLCSCCVVQDKSNCRS